MRKYIDKKNKFLEIFNPNNGFYMRSGVIENNKDTNVDPFMRDFPQLLDIGIMGACEHGKSGLCVQAGVECYQSGLTKQLPDMTLEDYQSIIDQSKDKVFQCIKSDEIVLVKKTKTGNPVSIEINDIEPGFYVYNGERYVEVLEKKSKTVPSYLQITFNGNKKISCTYDHKFPVNEINNIAQAKDIKIGDQMFFIDNKNPKNLKSLNLIERIFENKLEERFFVSGLSKSFLKDKNLKLKNANKTINLSKLKPYLKDLKHQDIELIIERSPYRIMPEIKISDEFLILLGNYIANGSYRSYVTANDKPNMINAIRTGLAHSFPNYKYNEYNDANKNTIELTSSNINKVIFDKILNCRNYENEKQLPSFIFECSFSQKLKFLRGYFADGSLRINNNGETSATLTFNTSSKKLFKDLCLLLSTMRINYKVYSKEVEQSYYAKEDRFINRKRRYRINISNKIDLNNIYEITADHKDHDAFLKNIKITSSYAYTTGSIKDGSIVKNIEVIEKKTNVVDINIKSEDKLFATSHGLLTHNCALGGRGDPNKHKDFEAILKYTRENNIVPNYTTSGLDLTEKEVELTKKHCGAAAVSWYRAAHTERAIQMFLNAGVKTNIHYVLGNNTIEEAIRRIKKDDFPKGINAVIFLLHKPVGQGSEENILDPADPKVKEFFEAVDRFETSFKIGFDSCSIPGILNFTKNINRMSIDSCEAARHSAYVSSDMKMIPCSFDQNHRWSVDLKRHSIQEAWDSIIFENFRDSFRNSCSNCNDWKECMGGCPIIKNIALCGRKEKDLAPYKPIMDDDPFLTKGWEKYGFGG